MLKRVLLCYYRFDHTDRLMYCWILLYEERYYCNSTNVRCWFLWTMLSWLVLSPRFRGRYSLSCWNIQIIYRRYCTKQLH